MLMVMRVGSLVTFAPDMFSAHIRFCRRVMLESLGRVAYLNLAKHHTSAKHRFILLLWAANRQVPKFIFP